ncbi:MAG: DUF4368 domain-containing protein [Oscillospiraceae bacterium]
MNNISRKFTNILEVLKLEAQVPDFPPELDRIHVSNGTLTLNGTFTEGRPAIVRSRLPVAYNPDAPAPVIWLNFLDGLLHAENIPTLQEFIGYRGTCTAHYIREETLRDLILERIRAVCDYIRSDVDVFQEEWLQCRRTDQEKSILEDQRKIAKAKKRLADLDVLITRIYEDAVLGNLSQERYQKMSQSYEEEQERLKLEIEVTEEWVDQQMELEDNLDAFLALTEKYVDVQELTPTIVNEFIKKILVYAPDKSSGKRKQRVRIFFNFLDEVEIPAVFEPIIYERPTKNRKTA